MAERSSLNNTLAALEVIRDGSADSLRKEGALAGAAACVGIVNNAIRASLDMAKALQLAVAGDLAFANKLVADLCINEMRID